MAHHLSGEIDLVRRSISPDFLFLDVGSEPLSGVSQISVWGNVTRFTLHLSPFELAIRPAVDKVFLARH